MPSWILVALLAAFLWAVVNVLDKTILSRSQVTLKPRLMLDMVVSGIMALVCWPFLNLQDYHFLGIILGVLSGVFLFGFNVLYYKSLQSSSVTVVAIYLQLVPAFSLILGWMVFSEQFDITVYLGIALIIIGTGVVALDEKIIQRQEKSKGADVKTLLAYVFPGALLMTANYGLVEYLVEIESVFPVYVLGRIGVVIATALFFVLVNSPFREVNSVIFGEQARPTLFLAVGFIEVLNLLAIFLIALAYSLGSITLVATSASTQPLFVILIVGLISLFGAKSPTGGIFRRGWVLLLARSLAAAVQIVGIYYISTATI